MKAHFRFISPPGAIHCIWLVSKCVNGYCHRSTNPMKQSFLYTMPLITALSVALTTTDALGQSNAATPSGFELKRGVNLSHWLSQTSG